MDPEASWVKVGGGSRGAPHREAMVGRRDAHGDDFFCIDADVEVLVERGFEAVELLPGDDFHPRGAVVFAFLVFHVDFDMVVDEVPNLPLG